MCEIPNLFIQYIGEAAWLADELIRYAPLDVGHDAADWANERTEILLEPSEQVHIPAQKGTL